MALFQIKSRYTGSVLFELECGSLKLCVEAAVKARADLTGANLARAYLAGAYLAGANLTGANLTGANLTRANLARADLAGAYLAGAYLTDADLAGADLTGANLARANLAGANLTGAYLTDADLADANLARANLARAYLAGANLTGANLAGANLTGANLAGANLTGANLTVVRDDFWAVLCSSPREIAGLRKALVEGRVDGSTYHGACACLVGTLANERQCDYEDIPGLAPNSSRPAERFFFGIKRGDTPENSKFAAIAVGWIDEFTANMQAAFGKAGE